MGQEPIVIYLDSADPAEVALAAEAGLVSGVTTNPALMARQPGAPLDQLRHLLRIFAAGPVFYQPSSSAPPAAEREGRIAHDLAPDRVVVKLPAQWALFGLAHTLRRDGVACAMTAVYTPGQALLARQVGCQWVIPYVDRARRLMPDGDGLVASLARALAGGGSTTGVLAASLKTPAQVSQAIADGARAVTVPMQVLLALAEHPLTQSAVAEFDAAFVGLP